MKKTRAIILTAVLTLSPPALTFANSPTADATKNASNQQSQAISTMADLVKRLNALNALQSVRAELIEIEHKQTRLSDHTDDLKKSSLGIDPADLPKETTALLAELALDQTNLANRTRQLITDLNTLSQSLAPTDPDTAKKLRTAAITGETVRIPDLQQNASLALPKNHLAEVSNHQFQSIVGLRQMITDLDGRPQESDLAAFIKLYEAIRTAQIDIQSQTTRIDKSREHALDHQIDRKVTLTLPRLSASQSSLSAQVTSLSSNDRLKEYPAIVWMNSQIAAAMNQSQAQLKTADLGPALASAQTTAIDRLTDLIDALKEELAEPSPFLSDPPPGNSPTGAPGNSPSHPKLLPPIAQIKLIKAMQTAVNAQTVSVHKALKTAANDTEKQRLEQQAQSLGKSQGELKTITEDILKQLQ